MTLRRTFALALAAGLLAAGAARAEPLAACRLPDAVPAAEPQTPPPGEVHADTPTAAYLLSLIWSPEECRAHGDGADARTQCRDNRFGFTVHGLWPNGPARTHPRFCRPAPPVEPTLVRSTLCLTPSASLIQHEWAAHGVCGWRTPADYFAAATRLRTALDAPDLHPNAEGFLTAGEIRTAFIAKNPTLPRDGLDVHAGPGGRLQEVRVCYDLAFRPARCLSGLGAPDAAPVRITPRG